KSYFVARRPQVYAAVEQFAMECLIVFHVTVIDIAGSQDGLFVGKSKPKNRADLENLEPVVFGGSIALYRFDELRGLRVEVFIEITAFKYRELCDSRSHGYGIAR